ncbi:DUF4010 domain-containing protein [Nitratiruptor sp. YY09-18]|uniref:MgtC/SapB family protein n=1 Tax=Nitratiruptor sp. YY09-18 TaxID=2724901 RepID=UPI001916BE34|nr:DUF4010 domain-containing protein [Nitratiruptor sp. YY09-18]BCD68147.1 hypothetical protein NitYY0918_C1058 [Nitratiruptor sp. YY09-18]
MSFIPQELTHLLYITALSFLVGLELKTYRLDRGIQKEIHFGSTRTFTFIGLLGFLFYKIDFHLYLAGFLTLFGIYIIYYYYKLQEKRASIISFLLIALVYSFGPEMERFNIWLPTLVFVLIVFILNANRSLEFLFEKVNMQEFETLGKFLLLSAVILPILPHNPLPLLHISAFEIWFVVVVISSLSYGSYLAQKYFFRSKGYIITAIFGGLYSSTATTVVLSKKSQSIPQSALPLINASLVIATAMMYIRLLVIAAIFNLEVATKIALPFLLFTAFGIAISLFLYKRSDLSLEAPVGDRNPLELGVAFIFAILFVLMILLTQYVTTHYGDVGLKVLSFIIGFTDIDPFILSLLTGKYGVGVDSIAVAIIIAAGSNNLLKAFYAIIFGKGKPKIGAFWLLFLGLVTIVYPFILQRSF